MSYSLYLLHVVVLMLLGRLVPGLAERPLPVRLAVGVVFLALALGMAWVSYRMVEMPARRLGRRIDTRRGATQRAAARTRRGENVRTSV